MAQWIAGLHRTTGHTSYITHCGGVYNLNACKHVLIIAVGAVEVGNTAIFFERVVCQHSFHLVSAHWNIDFEHTICIALAYVALAVHDGYSVDCERYALNRDCAVTIHNLSFNQERRFVGEVHCVALRFLAQQTQFLCRLELVDAKARNHHICGSVALIRQ